jgi:hypothetical protein
MNKNQSGPDVITKQMFISQEVFHLGNPDVMEDVVTDNQRYLYWSIKHEDAAVAETAGWKEFRGDDEAKGLVGTLEVPMDTISAKSALAGMEAWMGEKDEILEAIGKYVNRIQHRFGSIDTSLNLESVAVTRGNQKIFVLPPHNLVTYDSNVAAKWLNGFYSDLDGALTNEPRKEALLGVLQHNLGFLKKG